MPILGADLHVFERVTHVGISHFVEPNRVWIVGLDGHNSDTLVFVVFRNLLDSRFIELRCRAVIADEGDHQHFAGGILFQTMSLAIHARQTKIRRGGPDSQRRVLYIIGNDAGALQCAKCQKRQQ